MKKMLRYTLTIAAFIGLFAIEGWSQYAYANDDVLQSEINEEKAKRLALKELFDYRVYCVMQGGSGNSLATKFTDLFSLNAKIPNDLVATDGDLELVTPNSYTIIFSDNLKETQLKVAIEEKKDLIESNFIESGSYYEIIIPFEKTLSHQFVNGKIIKNPKKYFLRAIVNVYLDGRIEITGMRQDMPKTPNELSIGLIALYGIVKDPYSNLKGAENGNNVNGMAGLRVRYMLNPLSPTNVTQRANIRLFIGADIGYEKNSYTNESVEWSGSDIMDEWQGYDIPKEGNITEFSEEVGTVKFIPTVGLSWKYFEKRSKALFINVGTAYEMSLFASSNIEYACTEDWSYVDFYDGEAGLDNDLNYGDYDPEQVSRDLQANCDGNQSRSGVGAQPPAFLLTINPTYHKTLKSKKAFEIGLDARFALAPLQYDNLSFDGKLPIEGESVTFLNSFSDQVGVSRFGFHVGIVF
ncbi:MAG: hypothetical protein ACI84C_002206 [Flavobacteriales bacterium]|jgi:hypothetical protein